MVDKNELKIKDRVGGNPKKTLDKIINNKNTDSNFKAREIKNLLNAIGEEIQTKAATHHRYKVQNSLGTKKPISFAEIKSDVKPAYIKTIRSNLMELMEEEDD